MTQSLKVVREIPSIKSESDGRIPVREPEAEQVLYHHYASIRY